MFAFLSRKSQRTQSEPDLLFSEAYACIEQGLCYDEVDEYENTLLMYERGLNLIREAEKIKNASKCELFGHLKEAEKSVENRIAVLKKEGPKAKQGSSGGGNTSESKVTSSIREQLDAVGEQEADLIYFLPDGVQLFTVEGSETTVPTYPTSLQILRMNPSSKDNNSFAYEMDEPEAFIQVGPWVYPLFKDRTPVLRNDYGAYVLHNPTAEHPNLMVAILLPSDIEPQLELDFQKVLGEFADLREQEVKKELTAEENKRISQKIAKFLVSSGEKIAWGVQTTTAKVSSSVEAKAGQYRSGLVPTSNPVSVNPALRGGVVYMHKGSKVVAKCTRYLLDRIGDLGISVGQKLASGAQKTFGDGKGGGVVSGTITVLSGGIAGVSTVWISLEDASKTLCRSIADQTVQNVKVKYGEDMSETTHHALFAAGHSSLAAAQLWDLGPRSIAGRMARKAGLQIVSDLHQNTNNTPLPLGEKKTV